MHRSLRPLALAGLLSGVALPAMAEITPAEVWGDWQRLLETYGVTVGVGDERAAGDALTVTDVALAYEFPGEGGSFATTIPELSFEDRGDGTVEITISPEFAVDISGTDEETGADFAFTARVLQPGLATVASRDGDTTRYDYAAPEVSALIEGIEVDGDDVDVTIEAAVSGITGGYDLIEGSPRRFVTRQRGDALVITVAGADLEDPGTTFDIDLAMNDFEGEGSGTITALMGFDGMSSLLSEGFATEWSLSHGAAEYTIDATGPSEDFSLATTAESGAFNGSIGADALVYEGGNTGIDVSVSSSDMPFPQLTFSLAETGGRLEMPAAPSEEAGDFGLLLRMIDLELDDTLWNMFDPAGQLPRHPATLVVDLAGKARWLVDVFDPEVSAGMSPDDVPGEIESLEIEALQLSLAGAEITGDGAFVFDNSGSGPFAPAPSPSGTLNLRLEGGNTLLDTLVAMGLLPEEQAMGARMMLGLFARPGTGPDTLVSTIEVGTDGSISANGQRIR